VIKSSSFTAPRVWRQFSSNSSK